MGQTRSHWFLLSTLKLATIFLLLTGLTTPEPAQGFSNPRKIEEESFNLYLDDMAICTKYKYVFDKPTIWEETGYQTCLSEAITTSSLPATLHFKFRVQSNGADEFQISQADAYLLNSRGFKIPISKWKPAPLPKVDGIFNPLNQIFYGAISLDETTNFIAGTYTLYLQLWNTMVHPDAKGLPTPYKVSTFTIGQGTRPTQDECIAPTALFPFFGITAENVGVIHTKVLEIRDERAPGLAETLRNYRNVLEEELAQIDKSVRDAATIYVSKPSCLDQYRYQSNSVVGIAKNALNNIAARLSKAEYFEKTQTDPCTIQSLEAKTKVDSSAEVIAQIANQFNGDKTIKGEFIDVRDPAILAKLEAWNQAILNEVKNLDLIRVKLRALSENDPKCSDYRDMIDLSSQKYSQGVATTALINRFLMSVTPFVEKRKEATNAGSGEQQNVVTEDGLLESDGEQEEYAGELTVTFSKAKKRFIIKVRSNLPDESLVVRAVKTGAKPLRFTIKTNEDGNGGLLTKTLLSGYTLTLYFDSQMLDQTRAR